MSKSETRDEEHQYAGYGGYYSTPEEASRSIREHAASRSSGSSESSSRSKIRGKDEPTGGYEYKGRDGKYYPTREAAEKYGGGYVGKASAEEIQKAWRGEATKEPETEVETIPRERLERITGKRYRGLKEEVPLWQAKQILIMEGIPKREIQKILKEKYGETYDNPVFRREINKELGLSQAPDLLPKREALQILRKADIEAEEIYPDRFMREAGFDPGIAYRIEKLEWHKPPPRVEYEQWREELARKGIPEPQRGSALGLDLVERRGSFIAPYHKSDLETLEITSYEEYLGKLREEAWKREQRETLKMLADVGLAFGVGYGIGAAAKLGVSAAEYVTLSRSLGIARTGWALKGAALGTFGAVGAVFGYEAGKSIYGHVKKKEYGPAIEEAGLFIIGGIGAASGFKIPEAKLLNLHLKGTLLEPKYRYYERGKAKLIGEFRDYAEATKRTQTEIEGLSFEEEGIALRSFAKKGKNVFYRELKIDEGLPTERRIAIITDEGIRHIQGRKVFTQTQKEITSIRKGVNKLTKIETLETSPVSKKFSYAIKKEVLNPNFELAVSREEPIKPGKIELALPEEEVPGKVTTQELKLSEPEEELEFFKPGSSAFDFLRGKPKITPETLEGLDESILDYAAWLKTQKKTPFKVEAPFKDLLPVEGHQTLLFHEPQAHFEDPLHKVALKIAGFGGVGTLISYHEARKEELPPSFNERAMLAELSLKEREELMKKLQHEETLLEIYRVQKEGLPLTIQEKEKLAKSLKELGIYVPETLPAMGRVRVVPGIKTKQWNKFIEVPKAEEIKPKVEELPGFIDVSELEKQSLKLVEPVKVKVRVKRKAGRRKAKQAIVPGAEEMAESIEKEFREIKNGAGQVLLQKEKTKEKQSQKIVVKLKLKEEIKQIEKQLFKFRLKGMQGFSAVPGYFLEERGRSKTFFGSGFRHGANINQEFKTMQNQVTRQITEQITEMQRDMLTWRLLEVKPPLAINLKNTNKVFKVKIKIKPGFRINPVASGFELLGFMPGKKKTRKRRRKRKK